MGGSLTIGVTKLFDLPGWGRFSKYQKGFLERRPYVMDDRAAYEHIGKGYRWFIEGRKRSPNFNAAVEWVKAEVPHIPTYDLELLAMEAQHYLAQILKGEIKVSETSRIAVAKHFSAHKKGSGVGKGGRQIFRADDADGLTGLPSQFSANGAGG